MIGRLRIDRRRIDRGRWMFRPWQAGQQQMGCFHEWTDMTKYMLPFVLALSAQAALAAPAPPPSSIALGERPIRRAEVVAFVKRQFAVMDTNRDGSVGPPEYQAYRARQGDRTGAGLGYIGRSWFEKSDVDGDGRVTLGEAQGRPLQFFDMADVNNDGIASVEEQSLASLFLGR